MLLWLNSALSSTVATNVAARKAFGPRTLHCRVGPGELCACWRFSWGVARRSASPCRRGNCPTLLHMACSDAPAKLELDNGMGKCCYEPPRRGEICSDAPNYPLPVEYCAPGFYWAPRDDLRLCRPCPAGTAAPGWGPKLTPTGAFPSPSCKNCPYTSASAGGSGVCTDCGGEAGFRNATAPAQCARCPKVKNGQGGFLPVTLEFNVKGRAAACCHENLLSFKICDPAPDFPLCECCWWANCVCGKVFVPTRQVAASLAWERWVVMPRQHPRTPYAPVLALTLDNPSLPSINAGKAGQYFAPLAKTCEECPRGTFNNVTNNMAAACTKCPYDSRSWYGSTVCDPCPSGSWRSASDGSECTRCPKGTLKFKSGVPKCCTATSCSDAPDFPTDSIPQRLRGGARPS